MITNAASLFDGIGGFPLALERAGVRVVASAEIDAACRNVVTRNLPAHKQFTDVREITGDDLIGAGFEPETGIITAGWPCQGNSVAGRREGVADPRSGLWREVARLLDETRPRWFIGENVPGLLTVNGGRDFGFIKESLEELGYGVAWRVLDAQYFGVPQKRKRVFIVGCLGDGASPAEVLFEPEGVSWGFAEGGEASSSVARAVVVSTLQGGGKRGYRVDAEGAAGGQLVPVAAHTLTSGVRRLTPRECTRLQGFPDYWTAGQSDSVRYRQLGNAVAVPVVEWIARRIVAVDATSNRETA